jgi:8-oxo-dGTP diphosphatase
VFETLFQLLVFDFATLLIATIMATTINAAIKPYSTAVAPFSHLAMFRIVSNISWSRFANWLREVSFFHKEINKTFRARKIMEKNPTMLFVVAAALTNENDEILLQKRPEGRSMAGLWEFPGGKVEPSESPDLALVRELKEELGVTVEGENLNPVTFASEALGDKHLVLLLYSCRVWFGDPLPLESPEIAWVSLNNMRKLDMPPADAPFIDALARLFGRGF